MRLRHARPMYSTFHRFTSRPLYGNFPPVPPSRGEVDVHHEKQAHEVEVQVEGLQQKETEIASTSRSERDRREGWGRRGQKAHLERQGCIGHEHAADG